MQDGYVSPMMVEVRERGGRIGISHTQIRILLSLQAKRPEAGEIIWLGQLQHWVTMPPAHLARHAESVKGRNTVCAYGEEKTARKSPQDGCRILHWNTYVLALLGR